MNDAEIDAICERIVNMPAKDKVAFLLGMLEKVSDERDRLRAIVDLVKEYRVQHGRFWLLENNEDEAVAAAERESYAWSEVVSALDQLDGSAEATDG